MPSYEQRNKNLNDYLQGNPIKDTTNFSKNTSMDKLKMHSPNLSQENISKIRNLFPACVTEARDDATGAVRLAVDFDQLRQELSDEIVEGPQERYRLEWPGKRRALVLSQLPSQDSLRPDYEASLNFKDTKHLLIKGDNLKALKLLQNSYLGRIGMIYIDPPYNTGNDFVYSDNFASSTAEYLQNSGQFDVSTGGRLVCNTESNGRYHSNWLSMIYPRLLLARRLLARHGAIFISIDKREVAQLRLMMDEIFGRENFVSMLIWHKDDVNRKGSIHVKDVHEYILCYSKDIDSLPPFLVRKTLSESISFANPDNDPRGVWFSANVSSDNYREGMTKCFEVVSPAGIKWKRKWFKEEKEIRELQEDNRIYFGEDGRNVPRLKLFKAEWDENTTFVTSVLTDVGGSGTGRQELADLKLEGSFDYPKNTILLDKLLQMSAGSDEIVLDFFAGSGTFGQAVLSANARHGLSRRLILVQLDEDVDPGSMAIRYGFHNIFEITRERVARTCQMLERLNDHHPDWDQDTGFRVLSVESSSLQNIYQKPDDVKQGELLATVDTVVPNRSSEDLLFQVLVDWGVDLSLPIRKAVISGKTVFFVDENSLVACFDTGITEDLAKVLARHEPLRVVFCDSGYASDAAKINVEQTFRQLSPTTEVKAI